MALLDIARLTMRQTQRGTAGWVTGTAALTVVYASSYSSISGVKAAAVTNYPESLKQALNLQDLTSPTGYLNSTAFGIPLLVLTTIFVVGGATHAIAGDEESGALDLLLSHPVSRRQLVLARLAGLVARLIAMGVAIFAVILVVRRPAGLKVGTADLAATTLTWLLLGCCLGSIALLISAATGRRSAALAIGAGATLFGYLAGSFLPLVDHLDWLRNISPYYWFTGGDPLDHGLQSLHCALLAAITLAATTAAVEVFDRRDLRG